MWNQDSLPRLEKRVNHSQFVDKDKIDDKFEEIYTKLLPFVTPDDAKNSPSQENNTVMPSSFFKVPMFGSLFNPPSIEKAASSGGKKSNEEMNSATPDKSASGDLQRGLVKPTTLKY